MDKNTFIESLNTLREHMKENFNDWSEDDEEVYQTCLTLVDDNEDLRAKNYALNSNLISMQEDINNLRENAYEYGEWKYRRGDDHIMGHHYYVCPRCGRTVTIKENVCPKCGLIMNKDAVAEIKSKVKK